jgi:tetratricopeptide (TPR) repeat protein
MATYIELFKEGRRLKDTGDYAAAVPLLQEAITLHDKPTLALVALAQCQTELGQHAEAIDAAQKAVALDPTDQFNYIALSRAYQRGGFIPEAEYAKAKGDEARWKAANPG